MRFSILLALIFGFIAACAFGQDEAEPTDSDDLGSSTFKSSVAESIDLESTDFESTVLESSGLVSTILPSTASMVLTDQVTATSTDAEMPTLIKNFFSAEAAAASVVLQSASMAPVDYSTAYSSASAAVSSAAAAISSDIAWNLGPSARSSLLSGISAMESSLSANPRESAAVALVFTGLGLNWNSLTSIYGDQLRGTSSAPPSDPKPANATATASTTNKDHSDGKSTKSDSTTTSGGMAPATAFPYAAVGAGFLLVGWL